jgi:hypothetical protein
MEMEQWWKHFSTSLPRELNENKSAVEYLTGCMPLYLGALFDFKDSPFDLDKFLASPDLAQICTDINQSYQDLKIQKGWDVRGPT